MPGKYLRRDEAQVRETHNHGPHALPFQTNDEYTDTERDFLRLVLALKKRVGPFPRWSDVCAALLAAGWRPPVAAGAGAGRAAGPGRGATGAGGDTAPRP